MSDFEKLGAFYLGRESDLESQQPRKNSLLYDAKDLTTHALVVGMTGSGKTGLSVVLLEEAAIDGIPALIIDPKGDMANLLLSFPKLRAEDFRPWIDESEAARKGLTPEDYAARTAETWQTGLRDWGQTKRRIARFRAAADLAIFTPGSESGLGLNLLRSFAAPPKEILEDPDGLRERTLTAVSSLLGLIGVDADPIQSREHILISNLMSRAWSERKDVDVASLIREIQNPPFEKLGVLDLESVFPSRDRMTLAMRLNNLLASDAFSAWARGEPLDVNQLLYTPEGRPRLAVFSIAHLSDAERMFFVTLLLNEVVAWMRTLPGTGSLRALLYMDEIFGYFPPTASPPSKTPMLTLLKQARAYGLGVVLATQNPVDLDYKGLANTGTWFLGRLQTARDKERVLEGLESASAGKGFPREEADSLLSRLGKRTFLMHNVHEDEPVVFQTRWAMSYLRGPLTRNQISVLMENRKSKRRPAKTDTSPAAPMEVVAEVAEKPALLPEIHEVYLPLTSTPEEGRLIYRPGLIGNARLHYVSARSKVDHWDELSMLVPLAPDMEVTDVDWDGGSVWEGDFKSLAEEAERGAAHGELPAAAMRAESYKRWSKSFASYLYRDRSLKLWKCAALKATSRPGEREKEFRIRMTEHTREKRDLELEKLKLRFTPKVTKLRERIDKAQEKVSREQSQYHHQKLQTAISFGATLLGALTGRKLGSSRTVGRATTAARTAGRAAREREDIARAKKEVVRLKDKLAELEEEFEEKVERLRELPAPSEIELEEVSIRPRKSDISVGLMALVWRV
jgi:hypothetical protein